jgi:hypothetical protein
MLSIDFTVTWALEIKTVLRFNHFEENAAVRAKADDNSKTT